MSFLYTDFAREDLPKRYHCNRMYVTLMKLFFIYYFYVIVTTIVYAYKSIRRVVMLNVCKSIRKVRYKHLTCHTITRNNEKKKKPVTLVRI